jgi:predicted nucleic acid-binding protein
MERLVFDTSAILNFGKRGGCEFLVERPAEGHVLLTTPEVERELRDPEHAVYYKDLLKRQFKIQRETEGKIELVELRRLAAVLGSGEMSVILLGLELRAVVVLDEKVARAEAAGLKLKVTGTLGILADALKRKWCKDEQCIGFVRQLYQNGFRIRRPGANEGFKEYLASFTG